MVLQQLLFPSVSGWSGITAIKKPVCTRDEQRTQGRLQGYEKKPRISSSRCTTPASKPHLRLTSQMPSVMSLLHLVSMGKSHEWKLNQGRAG